MSTDTIHVGIDPGASGAIVVMWPDKDVPEVTSSPDDVEVIDVLSELASPSYNVRVTMELVGGFVGVAQPGSAAFKFGDNYGHYRGVCAALRLPLHLVRPQEWQKGIPGVKGKEKAQRKRALKEHAARLFPNTKVTLKNADALLIAEWGRQNIR